RVVSSCEKSGLTRGPRPSTHGPAEARQARHASAAATVDCAALAPWVIAAREGARAALAVLDASDRAGGARAAQSTVAAALAWRAWRASAGPCVLGRGPRVRPLFSQDETTRFVPCPGVATDTVSLVDALARKVLSD
ncbi:MAG: hypothetical protein ACKOQ1_04920, partial [Actinomycetota bacterium]